MRGALLILLAFLIPLTSGIDKYVHMDLKGAPPRPDYFKKSLELFSKLGAKGVVIEWEDMFPLTGILSAASHGNAYSKADVIGILEYANRVNLTVVPLVQTFGHAEWLLKTALFEPLRENENYTNVFCIGNPATKDILSDLLSQIAQLHAAVTPMPYFHIGADEALIKPGQCPEDLEMMEELGTNDTKVLVYHHLRTVSKLIQDEFPETKILAWFDEFKFQDAEVIRDFELNQRLTPVVWKYNPNNLEQYLPDEMWSSLSDAFPTAWGGSAFKGANGNAKIDNEIVPYMSNNQQWRIQLDLHADRFNRSIEAVIVTGWQRYDHFSGLVEFLPSSMTSLALSLLMLENGNVTTDDAAFISSVLSCPNTTSLVNLIAGNDTCQYEGHKVRDSIKQVVAYMKNFDDYTWIHNLENGWFGRTAQDRHYSSRYYMESLLGQYKKYLKNTNKMKQDIIKNFNAIYFSETASEFLFDRVDSFTQKLTRGLEDLNRIINRHSFPVRPIF